jgi:hypothetical protein
MKNMLGEAVPEWKMLIELTPELQILHTRALHSDCDPVIVTGLQD